MLAEQMWGPTFTPQNCTAEQYAVLHIQQHIAVDIFCNDSCQTRVFSKQVMAVILVVIEFPVLGGLDGPHAINKSNGKDDFPEPC